ncbi:MAG: RNA polymerase sigma factor [Acidimicrobiales bacterium]
MGQGRTSDGPDPAYPPPLDPGEPGGSDADFVEVYRAHYGRLIRVLRMSGANPALAEDVTQEAFARALARWGRVRRGTSPAGYVYRSAFRLLARAQRRRPLRRGPVPASAPTEHTALTVVAVERALAVMPSRRRSVALLCLVAGVSVGDAAVALSIAEGTVRKHLDEARHDLQMACEP